MDSVAFTGRHPFVTDAAELGFAPGFRVGTAGFQAGGYPNVDLPTSFLDHEFRSPDRDALLQAVDRYEPNVVVVGDAYDEAAATNLQQLTAELEREYDALQPIIVPKCRDVLDVLDESTVVGYPNAAGYADRVATDFSDPRDWRGRPVHVLGGNPHEQVTVITAVTQPPLLDDPPANIVGVDGNGVLKGASHGEYWTPDGWAPADHLTIRDTVHQSLENIHQFYNEQNVWPEKSPDEHYTPIVREPDEMMFMNRGGDPIPSRDALEAAYVQEYDDVGTLAFRSGSQQQFTEWQERLNPV